MSKVAAMKAEAQEATVTLEFDGKQYTFQKVDDPSLDLLEAMDNGQVSNIIRILLGEQQYAELKASKPTLSQLNEMLTKVSGTELGKSGT